MLYLVATPIGHLADFSYRAADVLRQCDYILCEDTRHSHILLKHYNVSTPLRSFHKFKEAAAEDHVIADLKKGNTIALISDAGTPLIADPGQALVKRCHEEGLPLCAIPGPSAFLLALTLSGFPTTPFQFLGFLPKSPQPLRNALYSTFFYPGTSICYETPHRLLKTLTTLKTLAFQRQLCIARELTKQHEECIRGTIDQCITHFHTHPPRGEFVLVIAPPEDSSPLETPFFLSHALLQQLQNITSLRAWVECLEQELRISKNEAIKCAAKSLGIQKSLLYKELHRINQTTEDTQTESYPH